MNKVDMEVYHQMGGTYVVPTEIMNLLLDENENLNKGIDELVDKYTEEINKCDCDTCRACQTYHKVIDDLKSLKGE